MRAGNWVDPSAGRNSLEESASKWLANKKAKNLRPSTIKGYEEILANRVGPKWANYPISLITGEEINTWIRELAAEKLSPSRINKCLMVLRQILAEAVSDRLIGSNVMDTARINRPQGRRSEPTPFTAAEVFLLSKEMPEHFQLLTEFLCFTGVRMSEVVALQVGDIDLERLNVRVERSTVFAGGEYFDGPPKSGKSRLVPLIPRLADKLEVHVANRRKKDWLFPGPSGGQLTAEEYRTVFKRRVKKIGRPQMTPHSCRDTFASLAVSAGVPITAIAQSLGHADPSITLRVYSSFYTSDFDKVRNLLGQEAQRGLQEAQTAARG